MGVHFVNGELRYTPHKLDNGAAHRPPPNGSVSLPSI